MMLLTILEISLKGRWDQNLSAVELVLVAVAYGLSGLSLELDFIRNFIVFISLLCLCSA